MPVLAHTTLDSLANIQVYPGITIILSVCSALLLTIRLSLLLFLFWPKTPTCVCWHVYVSIISLHKCAQPAGYTHPWCFPVSPRHHVQRQVPCTFSRLSSEWPCPTGPLRFSSANMDAGWCYVYMLMCLLKFWRLCFLNHGFWVLYYVYV